MGAPFVTVTDIQALLEPLVDEHPGGALVFDADGTLWHHDVGCMVFEWFTAERRLHPAVARTLATAARTLGVDVPDGDSNDTARALIHHYQQAGSSDGRLLAELQVWAYAGYHADELRPLVKKALDRGKHESGFFTDVVELMMWGRSLGLSVYVVSASPRIVVEEATRSLGLRPSEIAAGDPAISAGVIEPRLSRPLPYGPDKVTAGRALLGERAWLATFGDSGFDLEMLAEARVAVGLGEKRALVSGLERLPNAVRLKA